VIQIDLRESGLVFVRGHIQDDKNTNEHVGFVNSVMAGIGEHGELRWQWEGTAWHDGRTFVQRSTDVKTIALKMVAWFLNEKEEHFTFWRWSSDHRGWPT